MTTRVGARRRMGKKVKRVRDRMMDGRQRRDKDMGAAMHWLEIGAKIKGRTYKYDEIYNEYVRLPANNNRRGPNLLLTDLQKHESGNKGKPAIRSSRHGSRSKNGRETEAGEGEHRRKNAGQPATPPLNGDETEAERKEPWTPFSDRRHL